MHADVVWPLLPGGECSVLAALMNWQHRLKDPMISLNVVAPSAFDCVLLHNPIALLGYPDALINITCCPQNKKEVHKAKNASS